MRDGTGWDVEFYRDGRGSEPAREWLDGLDTDKRNAAIAAIEQVLAVEGTEVCGSEWGKPLGKGLYEFRIRHSAEQTRAMFKGSSASSSAVSRIGGKREILLRVYFCTRGRRIVLLLGGYDKGRFGEGRRQQRSIEAARRLAADARRS